MITRVIIYKPQLRELRHDRETNIKLEDREDVDLIWMLLLNHLLMQNLRLNSSVQSLSPLADVVWPFSFPKFLIMLDHCPLRKVLLWPRCWICLLWVLMFGSWCWWNLANTLFVSIGQPVSCLVITVTIPRIIFIFIFIITIWGVIIIQNMECWILIRFWWRASYPARIQSQYIMYVFR